ncbi:hypothetical protein BKK42_04350 [Bacillus cereus]|nr:hypothetical protein BKK43_10065 [Bacillus cereus]ONG86961.1 hypothetical protein BKK42_04350 [Bacillus cereus]
MSALPSHDKHGKKDLGLCPNLQGELFPLTPSQSNSPTPQIFEGSLAGWQEQTIVCSVPRGFGCNLVGQVKYSLRFARSVLIDQHKQPPLIQFLTNSL